MSIGVRVLKARHIDVLRNQGARSTKTSDHPRGIHVFLHTSTSLHSVAVPSMWWDLLPPDFNPRPPTKGEIFWTLHYAFLAESGYKLRPKYEPGWKPPPWKTKGEMTCSEDYTPYSVITTRTLNPSTLIIVAALLDNGCNTRIRWTSTYPQGHLQVKTSP